MFHATLEKDVLYPGRRVLADGTVLDVTLADMHNAVRQGNAMLTRDIPAPWCWEHNYDAYPARLSASPNEWFSRGYFGKTLRYRMGRTEHGPCVLMKVGVFDAKDEEQAKRQPVSPMLVWDYIDDAGKTWPGMTIAHVAATPKPIQREQGPYRPATAALSGLRGRCSRYAPLGGSTMDGDKGKKGNEPAESGFKETIDLLSQLGLSVGDKVTDLATLNIALSALVAAGVSATSEPDADDLAANGANTAPAGAGPMVMSGLTTAQANAMKGVIEGNRKDLLKRVDVLFDSGRINKPIADKLRNSLKTATLSLMADGSVKLIRQTIEIEAYEALPPNAIWGKSAGDQRPDPKLLSAVGPVAKPAHEREVPPTGGPVTAERLEQIRRFHAGHLPGYRPANA